LIDLSKKKSPQKTIVNIECWNAVEACL